MLQGTRRIIYRSLRINRFSVTLIRSVMDFLGMMDKSLLIDGLEHGFVDDKVPAQERFIPQLVINDPAKEEKIITSLKKELMNCDWFEFSVAFITYGGINALLHEFRELQRRGIHGKIVASQYQNFTQPQALKRLALFDNIELRIVTSEKKMHTKCYIFGRNEGCDIIIGSSNLTADALCSNMEWNLLFNSRESGDLTASILKEFDEVFANATPVTLEWIATYQSVYDASKALRKAIETKDVSAAETGKIAPNKMQREALDKLAEIRKNGVGRALVISATGSGKTYLSAMDAYRFGGKVLYIVHRNPIIEKSMQGYRNVYGTGAKIARYDPEMNDLTADVTFCTVQTISKRDVLKKIPPDAFDYILIDEVHHAGAETYRRIIDHFKPKFLLGMTATPDRTDGYDIYDLFDHSIAYDIRLKDAMEMNLVCPFHYFGVAFLDGDDCEDKAAFSKIQIEEKAKQVMAETEFYGYSGKRVKGLIFCTRIKEAEYLSEELNRHGLRTEAVSGETRPDEVEKAIGRLETDSSDAEPLDYIITADLFNEGVDIPAVNQIVMLRPTESPIIYIQQLGRGLRLNQDKEFVVVLDFIGNYERNFNIPVALSGDRSYNRADARKFVESGDGMLPGSSTVSFDEISKNRIFRTIDSNKFGDRKTIREDYQSLRRKLGRIPKLIEFYSYGAVDPVKIIDYYGSYPKFLEAVHDPGAPSFDDAEMKVLKFISKLISPGMRRREIDTIEALLQGTDDFEATVSKLYPNIDPRARDNLMNIFEGTFFSIDKTALVVGNSVEPGFAKSLETPSFREHIEQVIEIGRKNNEEHYSNPVEGTDLVLCSQYSYEDVCRFLRFDKALSPNNIGGYYYNRKTRTFPIFVNYVKGKDVKESQKYEDLFENRSTFIALSKSTEGKDSKRMKIVENSDAEGVAIHLFVRKKKLGVVNKDSDFYYLGRIHFVEFLDDNKPVKIRYRLEEEVRQDIYDYLTMPDDEEN